MNVSRCNFTADGNNLTRRDKTDMHVAMVSFTAVSTMPWAPASSHVGRFQPHLLLLHYYGHSMYHTSS